MPINIDIPAFVQFNVQVFELQVITDLFTVVNKLMNILSNSLS